MGTTRAYLPLLASVLVAGCAATGPHTVSHDPTQVQQLEAQLDHARSSQSITIGLREQHAAETTRLEQLLVQSRQHVDALERENSSLRRQLVERDQLIASYFQRVRRWERRDEQLAVLGTSERSTPVAPAAKTASTPPPASRTPLPTSASPASPKAAELDGALRRERERLVQLERENDGLRRALRDGAQPPVTRRDPVTAASTAPTQEVSTTTSEPIKVEAGYYLRVISLPRSDANLKRVESIAAYLSQQLAVSNARARTCGAHLVVDLGPFTTRNSPEVIDLRQRVRATRFEGRLDFLSAYFTQYTQP